MSTATKQKTIRGKLMEMLCERGMFSNQAEQVMTRVEALPHLESMRSRWQDYVDGYPPQLLSGLWLTVRDTALAWIDENLPLAWFRPLIAEEASA